MLIWITRRWRFSAAIVSAAIYAGCVLAPSMALAFTYGSMAHCLTDSGAPHVHVQGDAHEHGLAHVQDESTDHRHSGDAAPATGGDSSQPKHAGSCCCLVCFVAVTSDLDLVVGQPVHASPVLPAVDEYLSGRGRDRIDRPPITLLSL